MLVLCARYQLRPVGLALNSSKSRTACDDGSPANPPNGHVCQIRGSRCRGYATSVHHLLPPAPCRASNWVAAELPPTGVEISHFGGCREYRRASAPVQPGR